jgi:trans-aconitate methyltransferase
VKKGYKNIVLLDYSKKMLAEARKNKELKRCKFIQQDIAKMKSRNKYGLIFSMFSFASNSYFQEKEMPRLWKKVAAQLKPRGIFMMMGYDFDPPKKWFKKIQSGKYEIVPGYQAQWYIGRKC